MDVNEKTEDMDNQARKFTEKHGSPPKFPIRIRYNCGGISCEGNLINERMIQGFPGMIGSLDKDVKDIVMLRDKEGRKFQ